MKKHLRKVIATVVAALMTCALCLGLFAGCTGGSNTISVYIFSSAADSATNQALIDAWKAEYSEEHADELAEAGVEELEVNYTYEQVDDTYFDTLRTALNSGTAQDIIYLSPKFVRAYALNDRLLDLSQYVNWNNYSYNDVWAGGLSAYTYNAETNAAGETIDFGQTSVASDGTATFKNESGEELGLYGVPKDYSSFGLMYNKNYFTDSLKTAYTSSNYTPPAGSVKVWNGSDWENSDSYINIGVTTKYYPFNFYNYDTYEEALADGDPIAMLAQRNDGYEVTIPGWPGDTYTVEGADGTIYDSTLGYVTYTYSEYSAMTYAVCMFAQLADRNSNGSHTLMKWLNDPYYSNTNFVYGNDQYEGTLYLTAWLLGNDADIIDSDSRSVDARYSYDANGQRSENTSAHANSDGLYTFDEGAESYGINSEAFVEAYAAFLAYGSDWNGNAYFAGNENEDEATRGGFALMQAGRAVFYGVGTWDLQNFNSTPVNRLNIGIMPEPVSEDYAIASKVKDYKYQEAYYSNDYTSTSWSEDNLAGASSNEYADTVRVANTSSTYNPYDSNWTIDSTSSDNATWVKMMDARQDEWFARMDTVGYAVNRQVLNVGEWKAKAAADLCAYLAMAEEGQLSLTYSGSQLSSLVSQCYSYVRYADGDNAFTGTEYANDFAKMLSPDGNAEGTLEVSEAEMNLVKGYYTGSVAGFSGILTYTSDDIANVINGMLNETASGGVITLEGEQIWYFAVGAANYMQSRRATAKSPREFITNNFPSLVPYLNEYYADSDLNSLVTPGVNMCYKALNMVSLDRESRNLQVRMTALNGAADSCMYTYSSSWIDQEFVRYKGNALLAYNVDKDEWILSQLDTELLSNDLANNATVQGTLNALFPLPTIDTDASSMTNNHTGNFVTPATYCLTIVSYVQADLLTNSILDELNQLM